ncbi:hypothetical protein DQO83_10790 [Salmonella enterica]|nr:hypothetical protein [Salmonella enterica]
MTITKERLLKIQHWRETYGAGSNVILPAEEAEELARIALASLEAKPIGAFHIADQQVDGTTDYIKDGEWPIDNGVIDVYAAPPAPVATGATNSPVIPDGYALVPVEPTDEMIAAAMNCEDVLFNSDESFCVQYREIYCAMVDTAPALNKGEY